LALSTSNNVTRFQTEDIFASLHERLLGHDPQIREVNALISQLAQTDLTVLITGETGTGKDIVARQLHKLSPRQEKPYIKVNCPSIPEGVFESELFGYERGAFTGAHTSRPGRFELANEGTLFLDEICDAPPQFQGKLIQVLDGEPFMRVGGTVPVYASVRVIAATNLTLEEAITSGRLRKDISFRLSEVVVYLPPLRERRGDISLLAEHFNYNMCKIMKKKYKRLSGDLMATLEQQDWPGNVRELAGKVKEYVVTGLPEALLSEQSELAPRKALCGGKRSNEGTRLGDTLGQGVPTASGREFIPLKVVAKQAADSAEKALIEETLRYTLWNRRKAAKLLKTSYSSLLRRIEAFEIGKS